MLFCCRNFKVLLVLDTMSLDLEHKINICALYFSNYVGELNRAL